MHYRSYCEAAADLIAAFDGGVPLRHFLKDFFSANRKFGSYDRKQITAACYAFFRLGRALPGWPFRDKILIGLFLSNRTHNAMLEDLRPEWNLQIGLKLADKISLIDPAFQVTDIFPWKDAISEGVDHYQYCLSFLSQPSLFLRIRPGCADVVQENLQGSKIPYRQIDPSCIELSNRTKVESVLQIDRQVVVQDYSSQRTAELLQSLHLPLVPKVWDCCAGSGGKSIMLYDWNHAIDLSVSDNRPAILANLGKRFHAAGIEKYRSFMVDLASGHLKMAKPVFDLVVADVPCTGSGTWSRTPENLYYFDNKQIARYNALQRRIISQIVSRLKKGGSLLYITCSVFREENELVTESLQAEYPLRLARAGVLTGYNNRSDTLFAALFTA